MTDRIPDRLSINESDKKEYLRLKGKDSPFKDKDNKDLFMMALIVGYSEVKTKVKLEKKLGYAQLNTFNDEDLTIIKSIAVAEAKSLDILTDKVEVLSIAEQYANSGIKMFKDEVFNGEYGDYIRRIESKLVDAFEEKIKTDLDV